MSRFSYTLVLATALLGLNASAAFAQTYEQRTSQSVSLPAQAGAPGATAIVSINLPAGRWAVTVKGSVVNWSSEDYIRCAVDVNGNRISGSTTVVGGADGLTPVATLYDQRVIYLSRSALVSMVCGHDSPIAGEYFDPGASIIATRVAN